jgi:hypothetical protein
MGKGQPSCICIHEGLRDETFVSPLVLLINLWNFFYMHAIIHVVLTTTPLMITVLVAAS